MLATPSRCMKNTGNCSKPGNDPRMKVTQPEGSLAQGFEALIARLSTQFANARSDEIDQAIDTALASIGQFFQADRAYVFRFYPRHFSNTHEWCANSVLPVIDTLQQLSYDIYQWAIGQMRAGQTVAIPDVDALPEEAAAERAELRRQAVKSALWLPLQTEGKVLGLLGFDLVRVTRNWSTQELDLLHITAEIIASTLHRYDTHRALIDSEAALREAQSLARMGNWVLDCEANRLHWSDEIFRIFEINPEQFPASYNAFLERVHPDDRDLVNDTYQNSLKTGKTYHITHRLLMHDGRVKYVTEHGKTLYDAQGHPTRSIGTVADVTETRLAELALQESEQRYRKLFEESRDAQFIILAPDWHFQSCNQAAIDMFQLQNLDDLQQLTPADISPPEQADGRPTPEVASEKIEEAVRSGSNYFEWLHQRTDGEVFPAIVLLTRMEMQGQLMIQGSIRDITQRKQNEEKLRLSASVFTHAREGIMITNAHGVILDVNQAFSTITGYSREEAIGANPRLLSSGIHEPSFYQTLWRTLAEQGYWHGEIWNKHKQGHTFVELLTISAIKNEQGRVVQYLGLFSDITAQKAYQERLEHIAHYDELTGLPNRSLLAKRLKDAMRRARHRRNLLVIAYIDLDGFKAINDHHGHNVGDKLLVQVAERMRQSVRDGDTIARLGGDEFVAVLGDLESLSTSEPVLQRLLAAAATPVNVEDLELWVSGSIGVTTFPQGDDVDADQLLRQADQAMYQAKLAGKNRYQVFDAEQDRHLRGHHETLARIREGLEKQEFVLHYQPKVNLRTGQVIGAEALIRWQHPEKGLLPPGAFLSVVENHPLDVQLGDWVIATALAQSETWYQQGIQLPVSVNISALQLQQPRFIDTLRDKLKQHSALPTNWLELEILETSALDDMNHVIDLINASSHLGIQFSLDDFGTGYSSLTYLKQLPVNILKIDQSFVRDMLDDPDDLAILEGVLGLANAFQRQAIAEGVETLEHGHFLLHLGCELAQGYGIARPMPAAQIPEWIAHWNQARQWSDTPALPREQLAVLYAQVDFRAWQKALEDYLLRDNSAPPPAKAPRCRLEDWLPEQQRRATGRTHALLAEISSTRQALLQCAETLLARRQSSQHPLAADELVELHTLMTKLLDGLQAWLTH